jgi:hypothetical protein
MSLPDGHPGVKGDLVPWREILVDFTLALVYLSLSFGVQNGVLKISTASVLRKQNSRGKATRVDVGPVTAGQFVLRHRQMHANIWK